VDALLVPGRVAFARGQFFAAHELWEEVWRVTTGPARTWIQGLIQIAAGLHQLARGRPGPAASLLRRALVRLADVPPGFAGIDMTAACAGAEQVAAALERGEAADPDAVVLRPIASDTPPGM
jgi:predicted metal-dependent hydrolase